jgi:hypothetical protein
LRDGGPGAGNVLVLTTDTIQQLLAPVVLISAAAILAGAQYARLASLVGRVRRFHDERLELHYQLHMGMADADEAVKRDRFESLEHQAHHMLRRAALTRNALVCLLVAVSLLLLSSLAIGCVPWVPPFEAAALGLLVMGMFALLLGMLLALRELALSLTQVRYEHERIESLRLPESRLAAVLPDPATPAPPPAPMPHDAPPAGV